MMVQVPMTLTTIWKTQMESQVLASAWPSPLCQASREEYTSIPSKKKLMHGKLNLCTQAHTEKKATPQIHNFLM